MNTAESMDIQKVTILILIDGFLQFTSKGKEVNDECHNPYFNRWFSAILLKQWILVAQKSHNPYFNRWFSAIKWLTIIMVSQNCVTILILIDGFLQ